MLRTLNHLIAFIGALALILFAGGCENKSADVENVSANDVVWENVTVENATIDANMSEDTCADPNVMCGPPVNNLQLPATDTGPDDGSPKGLGAFEDPPEMAVGNDYPITFVAARDKPGLAEESQGHALTPTSNIRIAPYMKVTLLKNSNFHVEATSPAEIPIGSDMAANWHWQVRPLTRGAHVLQAQVEVLRVRPDQTLEVIDSDTSTVDVTVKVGTWKAFLAALGDASDLGEALTTLFGAWEKALLALVALIGAFWGVVWAIKNRGKKG